MKKLIPWLLVIALWHSIMFFDKGPGLSVILFTIPLICFIYYALKSSDKIKNKYGLLFAIPIFLLSLTYMLFTNEFFTWLNSIVIIILFALMVIYTIKPTYNFGDLIYKTILVFIEPFTKIINITNLTKKDYNKEKDPNKSKKIWHTILIVVPIVVVIILLLSSADAIFAKIFSPIIDFILNLNIPDLILELIIRFIPFLIVFYYIGGLINYLIYNFEDIKDRKKINKPNIEASTIKILLITLNIIYLVFDIIQIVSLVFHHTTMDISYAEYARQGFFQLMFVSVINLIIILICNQYGEQFTEKENKFININSIIMIFFTFIIIMSSFMRMYMYESEFGYTLSRLLVYAILITESALLIPTIMYIRNTKFKLLKYYIIIIISAYTVLNYINVDYLIAARNIERYEEKEDIDIEYLKNYGTDNVSLLVNLYSETDDDIIKEQLEYYFNYLQSSVDDELEGFQEFNLSRYNAKKALENLLD